MSIINRFLLSLSIFFGSLHAYETLDISKIEKSLNAKEYMYCVDDKNGSFTFEDILKKEDIETIQKTNLGYKYNDFWCRVDVTNSSNVGQKVIFSNPRSGMDHIDVNIYTDKEVKSFYLGDMNPPKNRSYHSVLSNFELSLEPSQSATIVTKYSSIGNLEVAWHIHTLNGFFKEESLSNTFIYLFLGFIFAMTIYKFFIYLHIRDKEFLIYALTMASILFSQSSLEGIMHLYFYEYIDTFTITLSSWVSIHLFLVFLWIFTFYFFNINKTSRFYYPLLIVIAYNIFVTLLYTSAYIWIDVLKLTSYIVTIAFFEAIFLLYISIVMFFKNVAGSGYFLIGHLLYILSILNYMLVLKGSTELSFFTKHSPAIGLFAVILFMSLALSRKFKIINEEKKSLKEQLEKNRQYTMIGTTITYISHQWKQPLSIISSQLSNILSKIDHTPNVTIESIKPNIVSLENSVLYINDTLDTIKRLFSIKEKPYGSFRLFDVITFIEESLQSSLQSAKIELKYSASQDDTILGDKNLFIHAITNIIQNSIEAYDHETKERYIQIECKKDSEDNMIITIQDSAGGIKLSPIESVFEPSITSKNFGTGIGLSISKNIIESKFKGTISVENFKDGARFTINIKKLRV